ncbi:MAG: type I-C CRISPR-associated protein Cas8c/Csd1 [Proteobacteria bacterium]|nr:type I-C CRISPR-associated protein Cas8c/Csd1 [Pseudomonadota bacterium]MBU4296134.1 type I-C CRISPR-associated protein Cas8c/Csd1 [Pseudomonadota bacterium]MCG2747452.1 type I-C CRISPR-associated protein Cas8c/Csd1 [Desulfobulbaceae bacterium]
MSWIEKLYRTYENNAEKIGDPNDAIPLYPICHTAQNAQIEIVIDGDGSFLRASVISKDDSPTIVPCTEASSGRSGKRPVNHPLCDKLQYLSGDFCDFGGEVTIGFQNNPSEPFEIYKADLQKWCSSVFSHPKVEAVLKYIEKGHVISDLIESKILYTGQPTDNSRKLLYEWSGKESEKPKIFKLLNGKMQKNGKRNPWQADAFICWVIETPDHIDSSITDVSLQNAWIEYSASLKASKGLCFVTGEPRFLADSHPAKLRNAGDKAKLISSNDTSGFTYRGRFTDDSQVAELGFEITQKGHSALRWLLARQGKVFYVKSGGQAKPRLAVVAWAVSGADVPDPLADSDDLLSDTPIESKEEITEKSPVGFTAQDFGIRLSQYLAGYNAKLSKTDEIIVMGVDSATPGRMAVTYYRELTGSDFLKRIETWHKGCAWLQRFSKEKEFYGVPAPKDIAQAAYGTKDEDLIKVDDNLQKMTVERLIPCIIDGASLPWDIVDSCIKKATQRQSLPEWAWQKTLGITCGLYRYYFKEKEDYFMGLDRERKTKDYLYGRLLAVADCLEGYALKLSREDRPTNATKLMQRFADRPCSTWRNIELALVPYKARLNRTNKYEIELDAIHSLFTDVSGYASDEPLSGEFLLGFHCQRIELFKSSPEDGINKEENGNESNK